MNKQMKHQMRLAEQKRLRDAEQQTENEHIRNAIYEETGVEIDFTGADNE